MNAIAANRPRNQMSRQTSCYPQSVKKLTPLFLLLPIVEMLALVEFGRRTSATWTLLVVLITAILGLRLIRRQGAQTLIKVQQDFLAGVLPANSNVDGLLLSIAAVLLIIPGLLTDVVGCCILSRRVRDLVKLYLVRFFTRLVGYRVTEVNTAGSSKTETFRFDPESNKWIP